MINLIAHLILRGRHGRDTRVNGLTWAYCTHRSHALGLACWRWAFWQSYCVVHNQSCFAACPEDPFAVDVYETDHESEF